MSLFIDLRHLADQVEFLEFRRRPGRSIRSTHWLLALGDCPVFRPWRGGL